MHRLKEEFTFEFSNQTIQVKKLGEVFCAISGITAKPLKIELYEDNTHKGKISTHEGKFLSWLPSYALEGIEKGRETHLQLIKKNDLPLFCEICLNNDSTVLEVHHVKEHAVTKNDEKENLRVYCSSCHSLVHNVRTISRRITRQFLPEISTEDYNKKLNDL